MLTSPVASSALYKQISTEENHTENNLEFEAGEGYGYSVGRSQNKPLVTWKCIIFTICIFILGITLDRYLLQPASHVNVDSDTSIFSENSLQQLEKSTPECVCEDSDVSLQQLTIPTPECVCEEPPSCENLIALSSSGTVMHESDSPYNFPGHERNWLEELVPEPLINRFRKVLQHNYTANFMRSTRSITGNIERLRTVLRKAKSGKCINLLILGGSVSVGHNAGGLKEAYHSQFLRWLNARYPCEGKHQSFPPMGPQTSSVVDGFLDVANQIERLKVDMVFVEYGANDPFGTGKLLNRMDRPDHRIGTKQESMEWITEILVRRLLSLRIRKPAILYIELSAHYKQWPWNKDYDSNDWHFLEYARMGAWGHYPVLSYYGIPTVSTIEPAVTLWLSRGLDSIWNGFFAGADPCCHPQDFFHQLTGLAIAFNFQKEMEWLSVELVEGERDPTLEDPLVLRPGWRVTNKDDEKYVSGYLEGMKDRTILNYLDSEPDYSFVSANEGWSWYSDSKNKTGFIATEPKSHISFKLNVEEGFNPMIGFLTTYEKISKVNVWFDQTPNLEDSSNCLDLTEHYTRKYFFIINPKQKDPVSVYASEVLENIPGGLQYMHVCLIPDEVYSKFKILKIMF